MPSHENPRLAAGLIKDGERFTELREEVRAMLRQTGWNDQPGKSWLFFILG